MDPEEIISNLSNASSKVVNTHFGALASKLRNGYYGWQGLGGSIFQWHPELNISFAYAQNLG